MSSNIHMSLLEVKLHRGPSLTLSIKSSHRHLQIDDRSSGFMLRVCTPKGQCPHKPKPPQLKRWNPSDPVLLLVVFCTAILGVL